MIGYVYIYITYKGPFSTWPRAPKNIEPALCIMLARWRRRETEASVIHLWEPSFVLTKDMNSTMFIPWNMVLELGVERAVWILMELNAYSNSFARVRYAIILPL